MAPYNGGRKPNKPSPTPWKNEHMAPTEGNTYQPPEFDFEEYGALKQRVKVLEETTKNHANSINTIENQRSNLSVVYCIKLERIFLFCKYCFSTLSSQAL